MNFSRLLSLKCADKLSIGRVQTPVLAMLVQRRLEIENFTPQPYWNVEAETEKFYAVWYEPPQFKNTIIKQQDKAKAIVSKCKGKKANVLKIIQKKGNSSPPLLFDLTTLQREANSRFNISAKQTLNIAQSLYEKHKIITYPRTDSRYISQDIFKEIDKHTAGIQRFYADLIKEMKKNINKENKFQAVNDKKVSDHHAIIPTSKTPDLNTLSDMERKIYDMICRRFIAAFLPPAAFLSTNIELDIAGERFKATGKVFQNSGWLKAEPWKAKSNNPLPPLKEGQLIDVKNVKDIKKMTRPPAQYNDSSLLRAMETAGKNIEDEKLAEAIKERGLGTPATRAAIIERLFDMGYAQRKGKSIIATNKGVQLIKILTPLSQELCSPEMTSKWEYKLKLIEQGKYNYKQFMEDIKKFLNMEISKIIKANIEYQNTAKTQSLGKCPECGGDIIEGKKGYGCSKWKEGCKFVIWKTIAGAKISRNTAKELLTKGQTSKKLIFTNKAGKKFKARLRLDSKGSVTFDFN